MHKNTLLLMLLGGALVIVAGIGVAWQFSLPGSPASETTTPQGAAPVISQIAVGTLADDLQARKAVPAIRQLTTYMHGQPIALKVTTTADWRGKAQLQVRLRDTHGSFVTLRPDTITVTPGVSAYCCWTDIPPGQYTLQVFRPEGGVSVVPLSITPRS